MYELSRIIKENSDTFYNYSTREPLPSLSRRLSKMCIALLFTLIFCQINKDFFDAVITVYSILLGFSFNVLFHLVSVKRDQISNESLIERRIRAERVTKISQELFFNISYFNIISIVIIVLSLSYFLFTGKSSDIIDWLFKPVFIRIYMTKINEIWSYIEYGSLFFYHFGLFFFMVESIYSFLRIMWRVSFYFRESLRLQEMTSE